MDYSLVTHNKGYQFSYSDAFYTTLTGFSGISYASRHRELGHRFIALIEYMPLLGGAVALIERIAYVIFGARYSQIPWRKAPLSVGDADSLMMKNLCKAVREHGKETSSAYAETTAEMLNPSKSSEKLSFTFETSDEIGPRPTMEDAKFVKETDRYVLAGVFDGHGGSKVSEFAAKEFEKRFPAALKECNSPVNAFEKVFHEIQQDIARYSNWNGMGSTAVVTYIDKETNAIYTATIGDSEANIYRETGWIRSSIKSIPLSVVRDWADPRERGRLEQVYGEQRVEVHFQNLKQRIEDRLSKLKKNEDRDAIRARLEKNINKHIRSRVERGVNTSRALGDVNEKGTHSHPVVIHKPKITQTSMKKGDTLILACDGLKDYVEEKKIVEIVKEKPEMLAAELVKTAIHSMNPGDGDNVTVIAIKV